MKWAVFTTWAAGTLRQHLAIQQAAVVAKALYLFLIIKNILPRYR